MGGPGRLESDASAIARGKAAYERRAWREAYEVWAPVERAGGLPVEEQQLLATAAALTGHDAEFLELLERLYQHHLAAGHSRRAARCGVWLVLRSFSLGESGRANGWLSRVRRLVEAEAGGCAEEGYLLVPSVHRALAAGDWSGAVDAAARAVNIGVRFGDLDLTALGRNLQGGALLRQGQVAAGLELLDEAMLSASSGELSPIITGLVYCSAIRWCHDVYALGRAREWTQVLASWCDEQPELVTFSDICLAHRAEVLQLCGDWPGALEQARRVAERFGPGRDPVGSADASYQTAEIHRLRGELELAEAAYARVSALGGEPQPGLALLRLQQGRREQAASGLRAALLGSSNPLRRVRLLPVLVELALELADASGARAACEELEATAARYGTEALEALATAARAAVLLAEGNAASAVEPLRRAFAIWHGLGAAHASARVRLQLARAYRELGDADGARLELAHARETFERLGATPDLQRAQPREPAEDREGLTRRELEVLRWVAAGKTNRAIAQQLGLSEKTVDRHVSNIFTKLDVSSRAAATAYAYQKRLL